MRRMISRQFYDRPTLDVARDLLGKFLVMTDGKQMISAMLTEVEAYDGHRDKASHAHRGKTDRNEAMFGPPGHWYVYLVYGMHWMLNVVTGPEDYPAAVLIRGTDVATGPGRLSRTFGIDKRFDGALVSRKSGLWIEDRGVRIPRPRIARTPRIGVDYAGSWAKKPYRFLVKGERRVHDQT